MQQSPAEVTGYIYWKFLCWAMSIADVVVLLDKRSESRVRTALPKANIVKLPNMVEIDIIDELAREKIAPPSESDSIVKIVFAGFITPVKGVRELVNACLQLSDLNFVLDMVGNVSDQALKLEMETIIDQSGKAESIRFRGGVDHAEVLKYMLAADLLVLPSHAESSPMVIIEAMGCGKPVIGTMTGAVTELLDIGGPQECGICIPLRDINALAEAIRYLGANPAKRQEFGRNARQRAEQLYSVPVSCEKLVDMWRSVKRKKDKVI